MLKALDAAPSAVILGSLVEDCANGATYDLRCALLTAARGNQRMSDTPQTDKSKQQIRHLRELIAALDRRVPRIERVGEANIARDAAALKKKALERLAELQADVEE